MTATPAPPGDPFWRSRANCRDTDPELFFPTARGNGSCSHTKKVKKKICGPCPVVDECLHDALVNNERHGIWGGKSELERRKIARDNPQILRGAQLRRRQLRDEIIRLSTNGCTPLMIAGALNISERLTHRHLSAWRQQLRQEQEAS